MGRFNAAKVFTSSDKALQDGHNRLSDLLDEGYVVESMINGKKLRIVINNKEGIAFYDNALYRGGIELVDNELTFVTNVLKSPDFQNMFIRFEPITSGGIDYQVLGFYAEDAYDGTPTRHLVIKGYANNTDNHTIIETKAGEKFQGTISLDAYQGATDSIYASLIVSATEDGAYASIRTDTGSEVMVDSIGTYMAAIPVYANNAAAIAGGLDVGYLYRTGGDPDVLCIVH